VAAAAASSGLNPPYEVGNLPPFREGTWQRHAPMRRRADSGVGTGQ
jgi:hypothetical protein